MIVKSRHEQFRHHEMLDISMAKLYWSAEQL